MIYKGTMVGYRKYLGPVHPVWCFVRHLPHTYGIVVV